MALPQLTDEQRKQALEKAAAARHARAELREQIKKGEKSLESVLNSDDPIASRMKVSTLIESLPGYGKAKARSSRLPVSCFIYAVKSLENLCKFFLCHAYAGIAYGYKGILVVAVKHNLNCSAFIGIFYAVFNKV